MKTKRYFLGVDVGGTKSHALIAAESGQLMGFGQADGANWADTGWDELHQVLQEVIRQALDEADLEPMQITASGFGIAEYDWPEDQEPISGIIDSLGLNVTYTLVNDALIALRAGSRTGWGVVVIAGTGTNCRGRDKNGREGRVTGMGSEYGEFGGATEIVERALRAIALAWTKRGPETQLSDRFLELTNANNREDFLAGVARGRYLLTPAAARLVFQVAQDGDPVAQDIIAWAGRELGDLAVGVIRQLEFEEQEFDVVLAGSTFNGSPVLVSELAAHIQQVAPKANFIRLTAPPVVGGVLLAMEQVGIDPSPVIARLIKSSRKYK
jgi:N-acetylglucosamine kinase-like BadF-type ATPase